MAAPGVHPPPGTSNMDDAALTDIDLYDLDVIDPAQALVDRSGIDHADVEQITQVMTALGALRAAEQQLSEASRARTGLGVTDLRALHYLDACAGRAMTATPGSIARHLGITSASTTKLLDRLERAGHVTRTQHPTDRRALAITVTPTAHEAARETVGRLQSRRFHAAARLTREERDVVIRFLHDLAREITPTTWAAGG